MVQVARTCMAFKERTTSLNVNHFDPLEKIVHTVNSVHTIVGSKASHMLEFVYTPSESFNDPSAGSPTETLLRLLLPLNGQV